jgi:hypothetical protein
VETNSTTCVACGRNIDSAAKLCPYCGADRATGQKLDTQAMLQEIFRPKAMTTGESVLEYARQRQGIVVAVSAIVLFVILALLHQFVTARNASAVSTAPPIPLTEIADLSGRQDETQKVEMPKLDFAYGGEAKAMRTFVVEPGAVTPPEIVAAQQAAAQAAQPAAAPAQPAAQPAAQPPRPTTQ